MPRRSPEPTEREKEAMKFVSQGLSNAAIAREMGISTTQVRELLRSARYRENNRKT